MEQSGNHYSVTLHYNCLQLSIPALGNIRIKENSVSNKCNWFHSEFPWCFAMFGLHERKHEVFFLFFFSFFFPFGARKWIGRHKMVCVVLAFIFQLVLVKNETVGLLAFSPTDYIFWGKAFLVTDKTTKLQFAAN